MSVLVNEGASVAARHAEIARRYAWHSRQRKETRAPLTLTTLRTAELERLFRHRFGGGFPDNEEGLAALMLMVEHHSLRNDIQTVARWAVCRAPWLGSSTYRLAKQASARARRWTASQLGWQVKLTLVERKTLRIRTIRVAGATTEQMAEDRKKAAKEREEQKRRAAGKPVRSEWEANSKTRTKPWEAVGMSRATWYRKGCPVPRPFETGAFAIMRRDILIANTPVSRPAALTRPRAFGAQEVRYAHGLAAVSSQERIFEKVPFSTDFKYSPAGPPGPRLLSMINFGYILPTERNLDRWAYF
jgi:hypothetical protein